jgi:hypothetical protein
MAEPVNQAFQQDQLGTALRDRLQSQSALTSLNSLQPVYGSPARDTLRTALRFLRSVSDAAL